MLQKIKPKKVEKEKNNDENIEILIFVNVELFKKVRK